MKPKPPLDYAPLQRTKWRLGRKRLAWGLICLAGSLVGLATAVRNVDAVPIIALGPPSLEEQRRQEEGEPLFFLGCCNGVPLGMIGLFLVITAFTGPVFIKPDTPESDRGSCPP